VQKYFEMLARLSVTIRRFSRTAYLDNQATTPMDPRVLDAMLPYLTGRFGNPHSRSHAYGWEAEEVVEKARSNVADLIGASSKEIIFTSGATESNNLAIKGVVAYNQQKKHIITTTTEHKCVLASCRYLQDAGYDVTYLPVQSDGLISMSELENAIRPDTAIVSVMAVNNEIGVIQPIEDIGKLCRSKGVLFHTDAAQALGKIPIDVNYVDLMSISGHKLYGPKGIGALYVRRRNPRVRMRPIIDGGGQERGLRSGTLATPLVVGLGKAAELAVTEMERDRRHIDHLSQKLYKGLTERLPQVTLNGSFTQRYCGNLNMSFSCVEGESLLMALGKDIAISSGSACTSASLEPSYVLRAIGVNEELAHTSLRFGIGRFTTEEEIDLAIENVAAQVERLREMSPLWDLMLENKSQTDKIKWS
jgi:cysteine desulfurase